MSENTGTPAPPAPPWGKDEDFDPEKAWKLIQTLRGAEATLTNKVRELQTAVDAKSAADKAEADKGKSETQRLAERLAEIETQAQKDRRALLVERAQRKHNLSDDALIFLTGETPEEIEQRAAALAAFGGKKDKDSSTDDVQPKDDAAQLPGRPAPALRPGHGGEPAVVIDAAALATEARARRR